MDEENFSKILFSIESNLKDKLKIWMVNKKIKGYREVFIPYIKKLVGTTTTSKGEN